MFWTLTRKELLSDCVIHEVVQEVGQLDVLQVCPSAEEIQDRIAEAADGRKWKPFTAAP